MSGRQLAQSLQQPHHGNAAQGQHRLTLGPVARQYTPGTVSGKDMAYTESLSDGGLRGNPETYGVIRSELRHLEHRVSEG